MTEPTLNLPVKWGFQHELSVNNANTKLGDGYQQFTRSGVVFNDQFAEIIQVSATLNQDEKDDLEALLLEWSGVQRFYWSPIPESVTPRLFVCEKWSFTEAGQDVWDFSGGFEKTIDPPGLYVPSEGGGGY